MKAVGIILIILCLIAAGGVAYVYFHANITFSYAGCYATDPQAVPEYFAQIIRQVEQGSFPGVRYTQALLDNPQDYVFYTWIVRVDNDSFLTAKSVELQITPIQGDILMIPEADQRQVLVNPTDDLAKMLAYLDKEQTDSIKAGGHEYRSITFLCKKTTHRLREGSVTWYLGGLHFPTVPSPITLGN